MSDDQHAADVHEILRLNDAIKRSASRENSAIVQGVAANDIAQIYREMVVLLLKAIHPLLEAALADNVYSVATEKRQIYIILNEGASQFHLADMKALAFIVQQIEDDFPELKG